VNPSAFIRADRIEVALLTRALEHAARYRLELDKRLARLVIGELSDALKRGKRGG
jgi:hypothetical protein